MGMLELNRMPHLNQTMESKQYFLIQNDIREDQEKKTYLAEYVRVQIKLWDGLCTARAPADNLLPCGSS